MAKIYCSVIGITHSLFDIILDIPEIGIQICGWTILALSHVHDAHGNGFQFGMVDGGVLCVPSDQSGKGRKNFSKIAYSNLSYIDSPLVFQERGLVCLGRMGRWVRVTVADQDEGLLPSLGDDGDELLDPATAHVDYVAISGGGKLKDYSFPKTNFFCVFPCSLFGFSFAFGRPLFPEVFFVDDVAEGLEGVPVEERVGVRKFGQRTLQLNLRISFENGNIKNWTDI